MKRAGSGPTFRDRARVVRVFISSTFQDMQAERDELTFRVFPELRARCRQRGISLIDVDLRWGITEEQEIRGEVLPLCLQQIDQSRPFFIGLLGERYGSVLPKIEDNLLDAYPWLQYHANRSLTEIEFLHGALLNVTSARHAFFYFRSPDYLSQIPIEEQARYVERDPDRVAQLTALKQNVRDAGFPVVDDYPNPEALGERVLSDLWAAICAIPEWQPGIGEPETRLAGPTFDFLDFQVERSEEAQLNDHLRSGGGGMVVVGPPGVGKSAMLAAWADRYRNANPDARVFEFYAGEFADGTDAGTLARRLAEWLGVEQPLVPQQGRVSYGLNQRIPAAALQRAAAQAPLLLIIDGLDELHSDAGTPDLSFLPAALPPGVSVVCSARQGQMFDIMERRAWATLELGELSETQRDALIVRYFERWGKQLDPDRRTRIARHALSGSPLFLRVMLEQLRVGALHEQLDERIAELLSAQDPPTLLALVLKHLEARLAGIRTDTLRSAMRLLWVSRRGLLEPELLELLASEDGADHQRVWSTIFLALQESLTIRSGLIAFRHDFIRDAVRVQYFASEDDIAEVRNRLIVHFENGTDTSRQLEELPWQFLQSARFKELTGLLAQPRVFSKMWTGGMHRDLFRYWTTLAGTTSVQDVMQESIEQFERRDHQAADQGDYARHVALLLSGLRHNEKAAELLERSSERYAAAYGWDDPRIAECLVQIGLERIECKNFRAAAAAMRRALALRHRHYGAVHEQVAQALMCLAMPLAKVGDAAAKPLFDRALELTIKLRGRDHPDVAVVLDNMAIHLRGDRDSVEWHRKALRISESTLGPDHLDTAKCLDNLAGALAAQGAFEEAEALARRALAIWKVERGLHHADTHVSLNIIQHAAVSREDYVAAAEACRLMLQGLTSDSTEQLQDMLANVLRLGTILILHGHTADAELLYRDYLTLAESVQGDGDQEALHRLGEVVYMRGDLDEAESLFRRSLDTSCSKVMSTERNRAHALMGLSKIARDRDELAQASELLAEALELCGAADDGHPSDEVECLNLMTGNALREGDLKSAESSSATALERGIEAFGTASVQSGTLYDLRGRVLLALGDLGGAETAARKAAEILGASLPQENPNLLSALHNLGVVRHAQNDLDEAEALISQVAEVRARVVGDQHPSTVNSRRILAEILQEKGEYEKSLEAVEQSGAPSKNGTVDDGSPVGELLLKAQNLQGLGKFKEAEDVYRHALEACGDADASPMARAGLAGLGACQENQQDLDVAAQTFRRALELAEDHSEDEPAQVRLAAIQDLARVLAAKASLEEAEMLLRRAIGLLHDEQPDPAAEAALWGAVAGTMTIRGEHRDAVPLYEKCVTGLRAALGPDAKATLHYQQLLELCRQRRDAGPLAQASSWLDLGEACLTRDDVDGAETWIRKAVSLLESSPDEHQPSRGRAMSALGALCLKRGLLDKAETAYREALKFVDDGTAIGQQNTTVGCDNLASVLVEKGEHKEAAQLQRLVLESREQTDGLKDARTLAALTALVVSLLAIGEDDEAANLLVRALDAHSEAFADEEAEVLPLYFRLSAAVFQHYFSETAAKTFLDRVHELVPRDSTLWPWIGGHASFMSARQSERADRTADAIRHYEGLLRALDMFLQTEILDSDTELPEEQLDWAAAACHYLARHRDRAQGSWDKALVNYKLAIKLLSRLGREREAMFTELEIQSMRQDAGRPVDRDRVSELAIELERVIAGNQAGASVDTAAELNNLSATLRKLGSLDDAERLSRKALAIDERSNGSGQES